MAVQIELRTGPCDAGPLGISSELADLGHVFDRHFYGELESLLGGGIDDGHRPVFVRSAPAPNSC